MDPLVGLAAAFWEQAAHLMTQARVQVVWTRRTRHHRSLMVVGTAVTVLFTLRLQCYHEPSYLYTFATVALRTCLFKISNV